MPRIGCISIGMELTGKKRQWRSVRDREEHDCDRKDIPQRCRGNIGGLIEWENGPGSDGKEQEEPQPIRISDGIR
jgi:hypothetical protein